MEPQTYSREELHRRISEAERYDRWDDVVKYEKLLAKLLNGEQAL